MSKTKSVRKKRTRKMNDALCFMFLKFKYVLIIPEVIFSPWLSYQAWSFVLRE